MDKSFDCKDEQIALVGIGCRYSGGIKNVQDFWKIISEGTDTISEIPENRWCKDSYYSIDKSRSGRSISKWGGFLDHIDQFDPQFFGISPREAQAMDPQQRLLLECSWESLEDALIDPSSLAGTNTGVFIGGFTLDYKVLQFGGDSFDTIGTHTAVGSMMTMLSNRISHFLDLRGPSLTIDTACSSSMVALHNACQSLIKKETDVALAGGVLVMATPQYTVAESQGGFLSPDGRSKAFDSSANGYVRGEGCGVLVLKRLKDAIADGDLVYSVILGTAVNHDGKTNGITVPRGDAQEAVIKTCQSNANVKPHEINYVEAHGTGTPVGDPIESNALGNILSIGRDSDKPCYISSVKTNIGHTEAAAGVAGVIKTSLCMQKNTLVPHLHLKEVNEKINLKALKLKIPITLTPWPDYGERMLAGVNSFGFGGTNGHAILEKIKQNHIKSVKHNGEMIPIILSGKNEKIFPDWAEKILSFIDDEKSEMSIYDFAYNQNIRRTKFGINKVISVKDWSDFKDKLEIIKENGESPNIELVKKVNDNSNELSFVYSGMGPQWWGMGRELIESNSIFRNTITKVSKLFQKYSSWSILEEMSKSEEESRVSETQISQPCNFALQVALTKLWESMGVTPDSIVGHSTGEVAAFWAAGIYTLDDAVQVIYHRSRLQASLAGTGAMAAVGISEAQALELIGEHSDKVSIAAVNALESVTLAGDSDILKELLEPIIEKNIFVKYLKVEVPFHSPMMEPIKDELLECLAFLKPKKNNIPLYNTVTGLIEDYTVYDAEYWWRNVRKGVSFVKAVKSMSDDGFNNFLEIGPHPVLSHSISDLQSAWDKSGVKAWSLRRKEDEQNAITMTWGKLFSNDLVKEPLALFDIEAAKYRIPSYPWNHNTYWLETSVGRDKRLGVTGGSFLGRRIPNTNPIWEGEFNTEKFSFMLDHQIQGVSLFPAAGYIESAIQASKKGLNQDFICFENVEFNKALFLGQKEFPKIGFSISLDNSDFKLYSWKDDKSSEEIHLKGKIKQQQDTIKHSLKKNCIYPTTNYKELKGDEYYSLLKENGFDYQEHFQTITNLKWTEEEVLVDLELNEKTQDFDFTVHPSLLDGAFQAFIAMNIPLEGEELPEEKEDIRLPVGIDKIMVFDKLPKKLIARAVRTYDGPEMTKGSIYLYGDNSELYAVIEGFTVKTLIHEHGNVPQSILDSWLYSFDWKETSNLQLNNEADLSGNWITLGDSEIIQNLSKDLKNRGFDIFNISLKEFSLHNTEDDLYDLFLRTIGEKEIDGIIYGNLLDDTSFSDMTEVNIKEYSTEKLFGLIMLVKVLARLGARFPLWILTKNSQAVLNDDNLDGLIQSSAWGIGRVIGNQEHVPFWGGLIDIDNKNSSHLQIINELFSTDNEDQISYRNGKRYIARLSRHSQLSYPLPYSLTKNSAYLITGAFGALGELTSRWLASKKPSHIILAGRKALPPREKWEDLDLDDKIISRINLVKELEQEGVIVHTVELDILNSKSIQKFVENWKENEAVPIKGVIHIAGIVNDQLMAHMSNEVFSSVYDTKVLGTLNLHNAFKNEALDFMMIYSSIAALVTSSGQANYAAANSFLDGFSDYRRKNGFPTISIGWGPWAVGMVKELDLEDVYKRKGMDLIYPTQGVQVLDRLLCQNISHAAVVSADWARVVDSGPKAKTPYLDHLANENRGDGEEVLSDEEVLKQFQEMFSNAKNEKDQREVVWSAFSGLVSRVMHIEKDNLNIDENLMDLGIDSMVATELRNRVDLNLGVSLPIVELLGGASFKKMVEEIISQITGDNSEISEDELLDQVDDSELADILSELNELSEEEAAKLLNV